jgi:hypothetical protein
MIPPSSRITIPQLLHSTNSRLELFPLCHLPRVEVLVASGGRELGPDGGDPAREEGVRREEGEEGGRCWWVGGVSKLIRGSADE